MNYENYTIFFNSLCSLHLVSAKRRNGGVPSGEVTLSPFAEHIVVPFGSPSEFTEVVLIKSNIYEIL